MKRMCTEPVKSLSRAALLSVKCTSGQIKRGKNTISRPVYQTLERSVYMPPPGIIEGVIFGSGGGGCRWQRSCGEELED